ncbi:hypothetical protein BC567DRAFT_291816 [Phyllosticta citribraziliensis]
MTDRLRTAPSSKPTSTRPTRGINEKAAAPPEPAKKQLTTRIMCFDRSFERRIAAGYSHYPKHVIMLATNLTAAGLIVLNIAVWATLFAIPVILLALFSIGIFGATQWYSSEVL